MEKTSKKFNRQKLIVILCVFMIALTVSAPFWMFKGDNATAEAVVYKRGMSGAQVKVIQRKLNELNFKCGEVDGIYGSRTVDAVKRFQSIKGLTVDGIVGNNTAKALGISLSNSPSNDGSYNSSDLYLLAKCIYAESRGEPYVGQVAVGAVVLNRVKSSSFPNSVAGVIYQPWAFTAVHDGQINLTPDDTSRRAAADAMNGWDPSGGCVYYYNPAITTNKWIWSRPVRLVIGSHRFAV